MPATIIELHVTRDGRYLGANDAGLDLLGYSPEELGALPFGTITGIDHEAAVALWRRSIVDHLALPIGAVTHLVSRNGDLHAAVYLGAQPDDPERTSWRSRFRLVSRRRVALNRPMILHWILGQWREAERRLQRLPLDAPERQELEEDLRELQDLYRVEHDRRRGASTTTEDLPRLEPG